MEDVSEKPKGAVGLVIKEGMILLDLRNSEKSRIWEIPGGGVENGETAEEAVKRELKEEVNINVKKTELIGLANYSVYTLKTEIVAFFLIKDFSGIPMVSDKFEKEVSKIKWVKISDLTSILNISWRVIDAIYFLSLKYKEYSKLYKELESMYDDRQIYSHKYFFYSNGVSKWWSNEKLKQKTIFMKEEKLVSKIVKDMEPPTLEVGSGYGRITDILLTRFNHVDVLEVNPDFRNVLRRRFGKNVSFIEGVAEEFETDKKYNAIFAFEVFVHVKSFLKFLFSVSNSLKRGGKLIISIDNNKSDWRTFRDRVRKVSFMDKFKFYRAPSLQSFKELLLDLNFEINEVHQIGDKYNLYLPSRLGDIKLPFKANSSNPYLFVIVATKK